MVGLIVCIVVLLLVTLALGSPVSGSLGFTAIICMGLFVGVNFIPSFANTAFGQVTSSNQLIAPLFIMMAEFLVGGNIAQDIYYVLNKYLKRLKGGLAISTTVACTIFAALCGSSPATAAAIGKVSISEMSKRRYKKSFAIGTVAGGGTLGIMIPPSLTFVQFGILTETSIVKLLMAGLLPGIMLAVLMCVSVVIRIRFNPSLIGEQNERTAKLGALGKLDDESEYEENTSDQKKTTLGQDLKLAVPAIALIIIVLGCMYTGVATPTEAAGIGVIGAILILFLLRRFKLPIFLTAMTNTTKTASMMLFMLITGLCLSQVITRLGIASALASMIIDLGLNKWVVMVALYILWFILGMMMSPGSMVVLTIPFVFQTLVALGFDPLWIGVVSTLCVEIGMITPPVGLNLFILKNVTKADMGIIIKGALPYVVVLLIGLAILTVFPQIALVIPNSM
ncbi:MAG: TRAP transporter large permease [Tannerellaceae bacterium]|nr:TRAP transporter large permease [Tannerellaceae bacterium]